MNHRIFREYDIRGVAARDFPDEVVAELGKALVTSFYAVGARRISLGRDCRLSSPRLHATLMRELVAGGLEVVDVGVVHSPALYFSVFHWELDGGVMITASHNAGEDNGLKIVQGRSTIYGEGIRRLRALIEAGLFERWPTEGSREERDVVPAYVDAIVARARLGPRRFRVIVDGGSGTGGIAAVPLLRRLGFEVETLYCEPDGHFPHHHPDPTVAGNLTALRERVVESGAEVGLAFDGDADRLGVVDGRGRILGGDQLILLFARAILAERPGATFVAEVKCSQTLFDEIHARGGRAVMGPAGHSIVKATMKAEDAVLAGEMSGHLFFADRWHGFDDAVYAGARLLELLSAAPTDLAGLYDTLPITHNTPEIRLACPDDLKNAVVEEAVARLRPRPEVRDVLAIDGARLTFDGGWALVRASHTGPVLVLRFEADSPERLHDLRALVESQVHAVLAEQGLPVAEAAH